MTQLIDNKRFEAQGTTYEIGEPIERTPEAILALESAQQLVMAQRMRPDGQPATMQILPEALVKPRIPSDEELATDPQLKDIYTTAYLYYLRVLKRRIEVPVPAVIGHVFTCDHTDASFFLRHYRRDTVMGPISVIPYAKQQAPEHRLFRLHVVEIAP